MCIGPLAAPPRPMQKSRSLQITLFPLSLPLPPPFFSSSINHHRPHNSDTHLGAEGERERERGRGKEEQSHGRRERRFVGARGTLLSLFRSVLRSASERGSRGLRRQKGVLRLMHWSLAPRMTGGEGRGGGGRRAHVCAGECGGGGGEGLPLSSLCVRVSRRGGGLFPPLVVVVYSGEERRKKIVRYTTTT